MPNERSSQARIKNRTFVALPPGHISVQLFSNSGKVPLKNLAYEIRLSRSRKLEGTSDDEGVITHENVPLGEYVMRLDGFDTDVAVPALPTDVERHPLRVSGYLLFSDDEPEDESAFDNFDDEADVSLGEADDEDWEILTDE